MTASRSPATIRILMTLDAVGGVWRYAMDLAAALKPAGFEFVFVGLGPQPSAGQRQEAAALGGLRWIEEPLDWMVPDEAELCHVGPQLERIARQDQADVLHLNLPSQAAGLATGRPVLVMSHSCVATWFAGVRAQEVPTDWQWHKATNRRGFDRADLVLAPSRSHATMLEQAYGTINGLRVVYNASRTEDRLDKKDDLVFAAGRWWDEGKNGGVLDQAAEAIGWPVVMAGATRGPNGQQLNIRSADHRGELARDEVMALMARAPIFVSPSVYEPFGLAPLEAARAHAALVLADIPTYRELWDDAALFFDPRDSRSLSDAVNRLIEDPSLRQELAARAAERSRRYDPASQTRAMAGLYAGLLQRNSTLSAAE